jgi:hypothetical protein
MNTQAQRTYSATMVVIALACVPPVVSTKIRWPKQGSDRRRHRRLMPCYGISPMADCATEIAWYEV